MQRLIKLIIYKPSIKPVLITLFKLFYPKINNSLKIKSLLELFKPGFMQRVLGFNRRGPWSLHLTSTVTNDQNITYDFSNKSTCQKSSNCYI